MTAYEMRISDWSSVVCSSDLLALPVRLLAAAACRFAMDAAQTVRKPGVQGAQGQRRDGAQPVRRKLHLSGQYPPADRRDARDRRGADGDLVHRDVQRDRKSTRLNSSH